MKLEKSKLVQNLKDAGCSAKVVENFLAAQAPSERKHLLSSHRAALLDKIHKGQKQLDCLDYLVYQINQEDLRK